MKTVNFETASGSVIGKEHYRMHGNCQDAFHIASTESTLVAVVCDGCSSALHSEVGAQLGARFLANRLCQLAEKDAEPFRCSLDVARADLLDYLRHVGNGLGDPFIDVVRDYFLFTVVGMVMTRDTTCFFSLGDGLFAVNSEITSLGPFPDNAPPYLGYALCSSPFAQDELSFSINCALPTQEVNTFAIGTDGVSDLIEKREATVPGTNSAVGPLSQFWCDDLYFRNPAALGNRLRAINGDRERIDWQAHRRNKEWGRLRDDTTLIVGRRSQCERVDVLSEREESNG